MGIKKYLSGRVPEMGCAGIKEGNLYRVAFLLSDIYCSLVLLVKDYKSRYYTWYPTAKGKEEGDEHRSASFVNYSQRGKQY